MISVQTWKELNQKQAELGQLIMQNRQKSEPGSEPDFRWVSRFNAERLKLALLVEVGEFANEIKSFKAWRKKTEIDWAKAKEELIDCLSFFLDLSNIYQIEPKSILATSEKKEYHYNKLLLDFFYKTNSLYIEENKEFYNYKKREIKKKNTYYDWLETFNQICEKLIMDEKELLRVYSVKNITNQARAKG